MTLQIGTTATKTEIIQIKQMFIFLTQAWLKNGNGYLLTKKIKDKHLVKMRSFLEEN